MNTSAPPSVSEEVTKLANTPWHLHVPADAPALFHGKLRWAYPAYRAYSLWASADGLRMSAAMSFYGMLSLAPLLLLIVVALGWWMGQATVQANLIAQVSELVGEQGASMLEGAIVATREQSSGFIASIIAMGTLIMGATGVFAELQAALERLWIQGTTTSLGAPWWRSATIRLKGVGYVMAFGFLLLVSLVISSLLTYVSNWAGNFIPARPLWSALNLIVSLGISTALFLGLMRLSSGPKPHWRHLAIGAAIGALLFALGKRALAIYLADAAVVSAYGAAGSLVVVLFWIYFTSAVLLFAASCARVAAEMQGQYLRSATPPPAAAITAMHAPLIAAALPPDNPALNPPVTAARAAVSAMAVSSALADLADDWHSPDWVEDRTPKAIHWAALLLAFSAGFSLLRQRSVAREQARTEQALQELGQTQHALSLLAAQEEQRQSQLHQIRTQARRAAWWRRGTRDIDRNLHETKGVWRSRLAPLLRRR